jgi:hypothetical protein
MGTENKKCAWCGKLIEKKDEILQAQEIIKRDLLGVSWREVPVCSLKCKIEGQHAKVFSRKLLESDYWGYGR